MSELADLLERFRRGPEVIATATTGVAGAALDYQPAPDKWSVRTIVCHLADAETVIGMRLRQIIAEDNPLMPAWDQDKWASRLGYDKRKISDALETFRRVRTDNYELLKNTAEAEFARTGKHSERGEVSLLALLKIFAEHPEKHAGQIMAVRAAYKEFRSKQATS
jgi:DinB superfamily